MPNKSKKISCPVNSLVKILCSTTGWANALPKISLLNATSAASLPIHIPIAKTMAAIYSSSNAKPVQQNMMAAAAPTAKPFTTYLLKHRKNSAKELIFQIDTSFFIHLMRSALALAIMPNLNPGTP